MRQAEPRRWEQVIAEVVDRSRLAAIYHGLTLEDPSVDEDFIRIYLSFEHLENVEDADLSSLVKDIEDAVLNIDDRYPSVRFAEAV